MRRKEAKTMREILFRGKQLDNGEWVEGWYEMYPFGKWPVKTSIIPSEEAKDGHYEHAQVDPSTVGQYTGLKDKNGKRIFEGDIVHCLARMDEANCVVIFEEGEFRLVPERNYKTYVTGGGYHALRCFVKEVIGNIHDNPEMLKGGED